MAVVRDITERHRAAAALEGRNRELDQFAYVAAWEFAGANQKPIRNVEPLVYEEIKMSTRSYK